MDFCAFHILTPGDTVTSKGELSTFLGFLIWGELDLLNDKGEVDDVVEHGALIGESNVFFGGTRPSGPLPKP